MSSREFVLTLVCQFWKPFVFFTLWSACSSNLLGTVGDHLIMGGNIGEKIWRLNPMRGLFSSTLLPVNLAPYLEPSSILPAETSRTRKFAVLLLRTRSSSWCCPRVHSPSPNTFWRTKKSGFVATHAMKEEISANESICQEVGLIVQPVALETNSGVSFSSLRFLP